MQRINLQQLSVSKSAIHNPQSTIIISNLKKLPAPLKRKNTVITVGVFDGVHRGHQRILKQLICQTRNEPDAQSVVLTFQEHPLKILSPSFCPPLLLANEEKIGRIAEFGIDLTVNLPFTKQLANLTAAAFITRILCDSFQVKEIIVGHDHGFGKQARGDVRLLEKLGDKFGFRVTVVAPVCYRNIPISSTRIRESLIAGKVNDASVMLGRPHHLIGKVVQGDQRGRTLGFPTANLVTANEVVPGNGVYAVLVELTGKQFQGIMNIGLRPTFFKSTNPTLEVHILNYSGNLYHRKLKIHFIARLRDEKRFSSPEKLIIQLKKDVLKAKIFLKFKNFCH
ncbi:MAG: bifunctional riboflavin kinase/FAD synthetase [bacterium]|nr:bifunctional riboflavin kinase/FAD synthetase [bacterium]